MNKIWVLSMSGQPNQYFKSYASAITAIPEKLVRITHFTDWHQIEVEGDEYYDLSEELLND